MEYDLQTDSLQDGYCAECKTFLDGPFCVRHTRLLPDRPLIPLAFSSLPEELEIVQQNGVTDRGVFVKTLIAAPCLFGPLIGVLSIVPECEPVQYALSQNDGRLLYYHLKSDEQCNWLKFVRLTDRADLANLTVFQQNGKIFFAAVAALETSVELRAWYSPKYASAVQRTEAVPLPVLHSGAAGGYDFCHKSVLSLISAVEIDSPQTAALVESAHVAVLSDDEAGCSRISQPVGQKFSILPNGKRARRVTADKPVFNSSEPLVHKRKYKKRKSKVESGGQLNSEAENTEKLVEEPQKEKRRLCALVSRRLQAVITTNPYQFPTTSLRHDATWHEIERLIQAENVGVEGYKPEREYHCLRDSVNRLLREYVRDRVDEQSTKPMRRRDLLVQEIYSLRSRMPVKITAVNVDHSERSSAYAPTRQGVYTNYPLPDAGLPSPESPSSSFSALPDENSILPIACSSSTTVSDSVAFIDGLPCPNDLSLTPEVRPTRPRKSLGKDNHMKVKGPSCQKKRSNSGRQEDTRYALVTSRLQKVITANPFQFPTGSARHNEAWHMIEESVQAENVGQEGYNPGSEHKQLRDSVNRLLRAFVRDRIDQQSSEPMTARDQLVEQIYQLKSRPPLMNEKDSMDQGKPDDGPGISGNEMQSGTGQNHGWKFLSRKEVGKCPTKTRMRAIVATNPFQFSHGSVEYEKAWRAAEVTVQTKCANREGYDPAAESRLMRQTVVRVLHQWKIQRVDQISDKPLTERDELVRQVYDLTLKPNAVPGSISAISHSAARRPGQKSAHKAFPFRCDGCPADFRTADLLDIHGLSHGKEISKSYTSCPECPFESSDHNELVGHVDRHKRHYYSKITPHKCKICHLYFKSADSLVTHTERLHSGNKPDCPFECPTCHKKFMFLASMKSHQRTHSGRRYFECPLCMLGLGGALAMQEHTETHRVDGQFHCRLCPKTFPEFHLLKRHLPEHTTSTYTCEVCQKICKRPDALRRHKLVHTNHYAFQCETCGRRFKRKVNYDDHMVRLHNPDRVYKLKKRSEQVAKAFATAEVCEFCTRQYCSRERLLLHQKEKHLEKMLQKAGDSGLMPLTPALV